ncbi:MAG: hypothetical protein H5T78_03495 [Nocardia sp.]|nr:hypothetical protein [Nocardia sp.]
MAERGAENAVTTDDDETGRHTGTKDKDYNLVRFVANSLENALRMEQYAHDAALAGDSEMAQFFRRAQRVSRAGADQGKMLLARRLIGDAANTTPQSPAGP